MFQTILRSSLNRSRAERRGMAKASGRQVRDVLDRQSGETGFNALDRRHLSGVTRRRLDALCHVQRQFIALVFWEGAGRPAARPFAHCRGIFEPGTVALYRIIRGSP
jgi:hypothetical protein